MSASARQGGHKNNTYLQHETQIWMARLHVERIVEWTTFSGQKFDSAIIDIDRRLIIHFQIPTSDQRYVQVSDFASI